MTVRSRGQGYGLCAEGRGPGRSTGFSGLPPLWADCEPASRQPQPAPAARYAGGIPGAGDLPEFSGETFAYAFAGTCAGKACRWHLPSLMVAINRCDSEIGRIVPVASAEI